MKYRVIKEYGFFYPQRKLLFWWVSTEEPNNGYHEESEALVAIEKHNKIFGRDSKKKNVVWSGELE